MPHGSYRENETRIERAVSVLRRPAGLMLIPIVTGPAYLLGGETAMAIAALCFPLALALLPDETNYLRQLVSRDRVTGLAQRDDIVLFLDKALSASARNGRTTGAILLEIDNFKLLEERFDHETIEQILRVVSTRLEKTLRDSDVAARLEGATFAIALSPAMRLDLESAIQMSTRIQQAIADPIPIGHAKVYVSVSVGFSLAARLDNPNGEQIMKAATSALIEAQRNAPSAIRSYSEAMQSRITSRNSLSEEVARALENGQIEAYYQPQVDAANRKVTGFETLARWTHPDRGLIPPIEFLPALEQAGLMENLGELMVNQALSALRKWDDMGFEVPRAAVNFSNEELRNPKLVDRIGWELDRHNLTPERLSIEVLETVVANRSEDVVIRNLAGLARQGCCLDLDDFGTGHASITNIRRFSIERIKIDRSFITRIDTDSDQQMMVSAILTMAERLGLETLAEGVETDQELDMLAKLGCHHMQGYGIARPMPFDNATTWLAQQQSSNVAPFHRKSG
ncbi:putative bifunctional diguanylate cyclase/phosphodiesterase [Aestuariibius sp. HNIBRBA575]|uniref:putative bifunctional diguanylate cyclase/phosphodiesterase n=1 Tax=Aestuariibius sp. HNIBRBA575 TaxID=3233343 RepID=UPI0034A4E3AB